MLKWNTEMSTIFFDIFSMKKEKKIVDTLLWNFSILMNYIFQGKHYMEKILSISFLQALLLSATTRF